MLNLILTLFLPKILFKTYEESNLETWYFIWIWRNADIKDMESQPRPHMAHFYQPIPIEPSIKQ